jgi:hypothetical protein
MQLYWLDLEVHSYSNIRADHKIPELVFLSYTHYRDNVPQMLIYVYQWKESDYFRPVTSGCFLDYGMI